MFAALIREIQEHKNLEKAKMLQRFFKTGPGEYGEGDKFLGISVPTSRTIAKKYSGLSLPHIQKLLSSVVHEYRLIGLLILVDKFKKAGEKGKGDLFNFYVNNTKWVNNWDLVDLTAHNIVGAFLEDKKRDKLYSLAQSRHLWERRIAMIACYWFIKKEDYKDALRIAEMLINDSHDLIHKAVGWMLREIGNRNRSVEETFLQKHYTKMPRTMLRYAIEKFPEPLRKKYLKGKV